MDLYAEALRRFADLFGRAAHSGLTEPSALTLATADAGGRPSARTVLLKGFDAEGFVFYTNTLSRKGDQLKENPRVALCFFWQPLMEQVLVEADTQPVGDAEADEYWALCPRESQLGAWASEQSRQLDSRQALIDRLDEIEQRYRDRPVPRPPRWSGYRARPVRIEFWKSMPHRLHERVLYQRDAAGVWSKSLLNP